MPNDPFPRMVEVVPEIRNGGAHIDHFEIDEQAARYAAMRNFRDRYAYTRPGKYARLVVDGELMMTDTDMERATNRRFVDKAHGNVLIAGLGLGMIIHAICAKPEVKAVVIIEKSQDVIDAVTPTLPNTKPIITYQGDIFGWQPPGPFVWDTIYFDIWPDRSTDNIVEINRLHRRYRKYLAKTHDAWMGSWFHEELKIYRKMGM